MTKNTITKMAAIAALIFLNIFIFSANARAQFGGGSGSYYDPYIISTTDHMTELANYVNNDNYHFDTYFRLDADLDYTGKTYTIIADQEINYTSSFKGYFNGNGHTISGVTLIRTSTPNASLSIGLFGAISNGGTIENLTLSNSTIRGRMEVGGIVGAMPGYWSASNAQSIVRNCHVTSDVTIESINMNNQNSGYIGGIVGNMGDEKNAVIDCTCAATIIASTYSLNVGGIVGAISVDIAGTVITGCMYSGSIGGNASSYIGGIVGRVFHDGAIITNNYVGGNCTIGAIGVQGSTQGTDAGATNTTHLHTIGFNSAQYVNGTITTPPTMNIGGTDYYASGSTISLSSLSTFGSPTAGNIWSFRATVSYSYYEEVFRQEDGTWQFTMPVGNAMINPVGTKDISLSQYPYATYVTLTPASATYTGSSQKPTVSVVCHANDLTEGTDFITDIPAEGYTNAGDYTFHIWGINDYGGLRTETFTIAPAALTQLTLSETSFYYDGATHTPTLTVKSGSKTLTLGTEYETDLPAGGFTDLGNYTIKAWGVGNYTDTVTATYTICHPWDGMGTWNEPFLIQNTDDMDRLATLVNGGKDYNGVYFRQIGTLDYTGKTYTPVGNGTTSFDGTFEGGTMTGISVSGQQYTGVFGNVGSQGMVRSVMLSGTNSFSGIDSYTGAIAGYNRGNIESCHVAEGANVTVTTTGSTAGGIVGLNYGQVNSCVNYAANVTASCAGGIVGKNDAFGEVYGTNYATVTGSSYCGGICGHNMGIVNGQHYGTIVCADASTKAGGIVGLNSSSGTVESCLSTDLMASLSGTNIGAIVGLNSDNGFAGSGNGTVTNCYYIGACKFGGIEGTDVLGQAMRGWPIIAEDIVNFNPDYCEGMVPGTYYNDEAANTNHYYVGAGETLPFTLGSLEFTNTEYAANGSPLVPVADTNDCGQTYYELTMPALSVTITITNLPTLELLDDDSQELPDNESRISMNHGLNCNVRLNGRTLYKDGRWNLLCLPFAVTSITGTLLEGAEVRTMATSSTYANGTLTLDFTDPLTAMEAGIPYLVRWSSGDNITDPVFNNITIVDNTSNIVSGDNNISFVGNLTNTSLLANTTANLYIDSDGQLHYPYNADYDLNALRGHLEIILENGVQVGTCTVDLGTPSTYSMLPAIFQTNGDWNTAANWNTGALPAEGADVLVLAEATIPSGYVANVGSIARDGYYGRIIVKDGGQLYHTNDGVWATVEKGITTYSSAKDGWHLIASPLTANVWPQQWNGFTDNEYDLYYYDEPTHYWINHKDQNDGDFYIEPLKGYLYANSQDDTLVFQNNLRAGNATVSIPLSYSSSAGDLKGFNLVGNPFAHNVTAFTGNGVADEVYRMNGDGSELVVDAISAASPLKPCEGFFVKATGDNASLAFNDSGAKGGDLNAKGDPMNAQPGHLTLEVLDNGALVDRLIVKREGKPLEKLTLNERSTKIYAGRGHQDYAVVPMEGDEQAVNFKASKNGTYALNVKVEGLDLDYLHLIDNLTGTDIDLLASPTFTFTAKTTDYAYRFKLVFSRDGNQNENFAFISNGDIIVNGTGTLQVIDALGRILKSEQLSTLSSQLSTHNYTPGVYVLRLLEGDKTKTQKLIIQ